MALILILAAAMLSGATPRPSARTETPTAPSAGGAQNHSGRVPVTAREAAIRAVLVKQVADWNRGDVAAFMQGYWNSPQTEFVSSNGILRGWNTVLERYEKRYPNRAAMGHLTFSSLEITLLGSESALAVGHWQLERKPGAAGGVFTLVFRRFPEGWRIINDHTSQSP